jgi:flagellar motor switch protein FliM
MDKVLNQEEIDALFRAAQGKSSADQAGSSNVHPCNFHQAGQINKEQVRAISMLHEGFARNLTHSLGAYLRVIFDVNLVSVEQLVYREFLSRIPDVAYCASFQLNPMNATAALEMDLPLAFPIIDLLLGGQGAGNQQLREITDIEEQILEGVVKILCRELETAWLPLGLSFAFESRQQPAQMQQLFPPNEKTLSLSFEIRMANSHGMLNLAFPAVVSNALLRKLSRDWGYHKRRTPDAGSTTIRERALDFPFHVELALPALKVRLPEMMRLAAGDVLPLPHSVTSAATLLVAHRKLFSAVPSRRGPRIAARVLEPLQITPEQKRNLK